MRKKSKFTQVNASARAPEQERDPPHPSLRIRRIEELYAFRNDAEEAPTRCPHCHGRDIGHDRMMVSARWFRFILDYRFCLPCNAVLHCESIKSFARHENDLERQGPSPLPAA